MPRLNASDSDDVKIEKIRASLEVDKLTITERGKTTRFLGLVIMISVTVSLTIIAWAAVRMTEKPAWLAFALATLACFSGQAVLFLKVYRRAGVARQRHSRWRHDRTAEHEEEP